MNWVEWFFQGLGTELIVFVIGGALGGIVGYRVGVKKNGFQKQKAKENAIQQQKIEIEQDDNLEGSGINGNLRQIQKAGNGSKQIQIGKIRR